MRLGHNQTIAGLVGLLVLVVPGCKTPEESIGAGNSGGPPWSRPGRAVGTTYYPYNADDAKNMGPGHFSCSSYNYEQQWYLAPSDTFGDSRLWDGPPCPYNPRGIPDCAAVQKTCGVRVKITCAGNCRDQAPPVVAQITDVCPRFHPSNVAHGACQNGPHFDIGRPIWELMHAKDDNISVYYEVVDRNTPLGPVGQGSQNSNAPGNGAAGGDQNGKWCDAGSGICFPYCTNGSNTGFNFGWQPELGGPNGGSCRIPAGGTGTGSSRWCDPVKNSQCFPYCTNGSNTGNNFGWQPELGGPNGGSCRVPSGGGAAAGGASGKWCDPVKTDQCFPYCTNGSNTGNNFGWQPDLGGPNGGSCRVP